MAESGFYSTHPKKVITYLVRSAKKLSVTLGPIWKKVISLTWSRVIVNLNGCWLVLTSVLV